MGEAISSDEDDILLRDLEIFGFPLVQNSPHQNTSSLMNDPSFSSTPKKNITEESEGSATKSKDSSVVSFDGEEMMNQTLKTSNSNKNGLEPDKVCMKEENQREKSSVSNDTERSVDDDWSRYLKISNYFLSSFFGPTTPEKVKHNRCYISEKEWLSKYKPIQKIIPSETNEVQSKKDVQMISCCASPAIGQTNTHIHDNEKIKQVNHINENPVESSPIMIKQANVTKIVKTMENVTQELDQKEKEENMELGNHQQKKTKGILRRKLKFPENGITDTSSTSLGKKYCREPDSIQNESISASVRFAIPVQKTYNTNSPGKEKSFFVAPIRSSGIITKYHFPHSIPNWNLIRNPMLHETRNYIRVNGLLCAINYIKIICPFGFPTFFRLIKIIVRDDVKEEDYGRKPSTFFIRMSKTRAFEFEVHTEIFLPSNLIWNTMKILSDNSILYVMALKE